MAVHSMTGFARAGGAVEGAQWSWEIRSVNGRGLDVKLRLPTGLEAIEQLVRTSISRHLQRALSRSSSP